MSRILETARRTIEAEMASLGALLERLGQLGPTFEACVERILECRGKVIFTGMGKAGHIARKLAATFASTGTPAFFVHPAEALHGDSGMVEARDLVIALSNSGETSELLALLAIVKQVGAPIIALTGRTDSSLAKAAIATLDVGVEREADPHNLAPTSSAVAALAMGDALAMAVMVERGFTREDFARFHPGGALGARLLSRGAEGGEQRGA